MSAHYLYFIMPTRPKKYRKWGVNTTKVIIEDRLFQLLWLSSGPLSGIYKTYKVAETEI